MKYYISGRMTGVKDFNAPAFEEAAKGLRQLGHIVTSPTELDKEDKQAEPYWGYYLGRDLQVIKDGHFDGIVMLHEWSQSHGAVLERTLAKRLGIAVKEWPKDFLFEKKKREMTSASLIAQSMEITDQAIEATRPFRESFKEEEVFKGPIQKAIPLVHGSRQKAYGHPREDFERTAGIWKAMFGWDVKARDIPLAMIAVKLSRLRKTPDHEDSQTDIAGYIECYSMLG